jgi:hypothetical protein
LQAIDLRLDLILLLHQELPPLLEDEHPLINTGLKDLSALLMKRLSGPVHPIVLRLDGELTAFASCRILSVAPQMAPEMMAVAKRPVTV